MDKTKKRPASLTPEQAHALLGGTAVISRSTFYSAIKRGQVPHLRLGARRIIIPRAAFEGWLKSAGFGGAGAAV
jgi:excisionase family DNA binding protein